MLVIFNKPYNVLCQFTDPLRRSTLADYIHIPTIYAAGRLDRDSEGLLLLTDHGQLQHWISSPAFKLPKVYWVQVEGEITDQAIDALRHGLELNDGATLPAQVAHMEHPELWPRTPPIRQRKAIPTSWIEMRIIEGRNRQVRRMTAAVGYPTLRLVRHAIGPWSLDHIPPGQYVTIDDGPLLQDLEKLPDIKNAASLLQTRKTYAKQSRKTPNRSQRTKYR